MKALVKFCVLCTLVRGCLQLNLVADGNLQGIIFEPYRQVYAYHHDEILAYRLDLSIIHEILDENSLINKKCHDKMGMETFKSIKMKKYLEEWQWTLGSVPENCSITNITTSELENIEREAKLPDECYYAESLASNIYKILGRINQLFKRKNEMSHYFIYSSRLRQDTENLMQNRGNAYTTPFRYDEFFVKNFDKIARAQYFYQNSAVYFVYQVPLYVNNLVILYEVSPKPIIYKHDAYIYKTNNSFSLFENTQLITYTRQQFIDNCYQTLKSIYCQKPAGLINYCDQYYLSSVRSNFDPKCFSRVPNRNMVTEIDKQLFFTIFYPMDIFITHYSITYKVRIDEPAKITGTIDFKVNGTFFYFTPDGAREYKIYVDEGVNPDAIYYTFEFKERDLTLFFIIIILIITFIVIPVTIHCSNKIKYGKNEAKNNKRQENRQMSDTYMAYTEF